MRAIDAIRRANQPRPAENSIQLRAACIGAVLVAIAACAAMNELSWASALGAMALVSIGMVFSYFTRSRPPGWIKLLVAAGAIAAFVWFFHAVSAPAADITTVENPLTVLLASVLAVHSFHVPARRDLMFSLAASAGLMAVGAAQAIDLRFGLYVLAWASFSLWCLVEMWTSASGGGRFSAAAVVAALAGMTAAASAIFLVLPAPAVAARFNFLARAGIGGAIGVPGALAGDSGSPSQLARAGTRSGPTRVGGYLGFAKSLDTALRGQLANTLVMLVRAQRPSYWVGETFDKWDGQNWTSTASAPRPLHQQSPFVLPVPQGDNALGQADLQTFYVTSSTADLVFHAETADQLWFPTSTVYSSDDGTIVSPIGLGQGAIYTVESQVDTPTPDQLRHASSGVSLPAATEVSYLQLPHPYPRVHALAQSITAGDATNYDKVQALIAWIGAHTHYSTVIPPLPAGADTVDEFLFGNRVGFCEQISTSLTVMLRTLGIPAREAVGYVPGSYNPITDLYQIRADDAHAWVQVWFPGFGWQSFDPTAVVPAANPAPGSIALEDIGHALGRIPPVPVVAALFVAALAAAGLRWRRSRRATWAERIARTLERAGRRAGHPRRASETLAQYAATLDGLSGDGSETWRRMAWAAEASAYGGREPSPEAQRRLVISARRIPAVRRPGRRWFTRSTSR
jgi:transglutaminase-like putative cysteine protease